MICDWCAHAADFASGRDGTPIEEGAGLANAYELAAKMHSRCPGCPCEHRPIAIKANLPNPEGLSEAERAEAFEKFMGMVRA